MPCAPCHGICSYPPSSSPAHTADEPLPIGDGQTISQPFMVAAMAEALSLKGHERVLEIGGGSGYQAAVLSQLALEVVAIEARPALTVAAADRIDRLGYHNVGLEDRATAREAGHRTFRTKRSS